MHDDTLTRLPDPSGSAPDAAPEVIRAGARKLIEQAIHADLSALMNAYSGKTLEDVSAERPVWPWPSS